MARPDAYSPTVSTVGTTPSAKGDGGLRYAIGAYTIWGLFPLYLVLLNAVAPLEIVGWRVIWTIPLCLLIAAATRRLTAIRKVFADRRALGWLAVSAALITVNWVGYVMAVQHGYFYAASLGYYINPLVNVVLGTVFLHERLTRLQWWAVALAATGIGVLAYEAEATLIISLTLAFSFSLYGLIRKRVDVESLPALTVETVLLAGPAVLAIMFAPAAAAGFGTDTATTLLLMAAGVMTAVPLLLFAAAARRMSYSALGFVQFLAPSLVFIIGLVVFDEPLKQAQLACFILIWGAIALFCWDILQRSRAQRAAAKRRGSPVA